MAASEQHLDYLVGRFRLAAYAESTKAAYRSQLSAYLQFCSTYGYNPVPASTVTICRYIAYLALTHTYSSIKLYLNVIRLLHIEAGFSNPVSCHNIQQVLKGVKRLQPHSPHRRPIMTTDLLKRMRFKLDNISSLDLTFWAACLLAFYGMLRISSLFPPKPHSLCVSAAKVYKWGVVMTFTYSKTVQYAERKPYIVLPWARDKFLCPASSLLAAWRAAGVKDRCLPLLSYKEAGAIAALTRSVFVHKLQSVMSRLQLSECGYSGHSFRRGGATHALNCGIPAEIIMAQGDWKSLAYLDYIDDKSAHSRAVHISSML